jgi:uncharacterized protein YjiS (DUF1127 family)
MSSQSRNQPIPNNLYTSMAEPRSTFRQRAVRTLVLWRQRVDMRRRLAEMDARSLRDAGISPAAATFESGKPFWARIGSLR